MDFIGTVLLLLLSCSVGGCHGAAYSSILLFALACLARRLPSLCRRKINDKNQFSLPQAFRSC